MSGGSSGAKRSAAVAEKQMKQQKAMIAQQQAELARQEAEIQARTEASLRARRRGGQRALISGDIEQGESTLG